MTSRNLEREQLLNLTLITVLWEVYVVEINNMLNFRRLFGEGELENVVATVDELLFLLRSNYIVGYLFFWRG
jgi:hypothetical protein